MEAKITCNNALCFTEKLQFERRIQELEVDLKLNASMLAKQTDLAREAEIRVKVLEEGIEKTISIIEGKMVFSGDRLIKELKKLLPDPAQGRKE